MIPWRRHPTQIHWLVARCRDLFPGAAAPLRKTVAQLAADWQAAADLETPAQVLSARKQMLTGIFGLLRIRHEAWLDAPDRHQLPALHLAPDGELMIVRGQSISRIWDVETIAGREDWAELPAGGSYIALWTQQDSDERYQSASAMFRSALWQVWPTFVFVALATLVANIFAFGASLYSMQVYDRVIPVQNGSTLLVLTIGALLGAGLELLLKLIRAQIVEPAIAHVDGRFSKELFERVLALRLDQVPSSIGSLAAQVRSYEAVRAHYFALAFYAIDIPFASLFLALIVVLGGPLMALVVGAFFAISLLVGLSARRRVFAVTRQALVSSHQKLGLLVESVEGIETIKATGSAWRHKNRWNDLARRTLHDDLKIRRYTESSSFVAAMFQQVSFISLIALGAWLAITDGSLTSGALIACSILSGRVLAPIASLPGIIVQRAQALAAMQELDGLLELRSDNDAVDQPLMPEGLLGSYRLDRVSFSYAEQTNPLVIERLVIKPGERVGILGTIGSGKSTLIKLLAGLYPAQSGQVLIDGLDINQISRAHFSELCGYLPQDTRLFQGTLKENLLLGLPGRNEEDVIAAVKSTGLDRHVASHPRGFDRPITESGGGLSRGQRQLVALTRLLLLRPSVWLLDEPTAGMDDQTEQDCIAALRAGMPSGATLVLITHRPRLLDLVDRLVILGPGGIQLDGPRQAVVDKLLSLRARPDAGGPRPATAMETQL
jgi:ATP-binding cassette subfamily C protein LapB